MKLRVLLTEMFVVGTTDDENSIFKRGNTFWSKNKINAKIVIVQ